MSVYKVIIWFLIVLQHFSASGQSSPGFLQAGDPAPSLLVHNWIKGNGKAEDFDGKLKVIEFGATWCKPCAAAIPYLSDLQQKYQEQVIVMSLFVQELTSPGDNKKNNYIKRVAEYVRKKGDKINYTVGVDDEKGTLSKTWLDVSGRDGIPQIFVVDDRGTIFWIGSNPQVLDSVINLSLKKEKNILNSSDYTGRNRELGDRKNFGASDTLMYSALVKFRSGQEDGSKMPFYIQSYPYQYPKDSALIKRTGKLEIVGAGLRRLFYMAYADTITNYAMSRNTVTWKFPDTIKYPNRRSSYGRSWYKPILEMNDSSLFASKAPRPEYRFNYYLKVDKEVASAEFLQKKLQDDLTRLFGYEAIVETRMMPCWVLTSTEVAKKNLPSKNPGSQYNHYKGKFGFYYFKNAEISDIIFQLEIKYGFGFLQLIEQPMKQPPFIDETGISGEIDFVCDAELSEKIISDNNNEHSFPWYREMLELIGIKMELTLRPMKVVVIRDAKK